MTYTNFKPFDRTDFYDYGGCERFEGDEAPLIYRNVYDGSTIVYEGNGIIIDLYRDEPTQDDNDLDYTLVEFQMESKTGKFNQAVVDKLNVLVNQLNKLSFQEKVQELESKFGDPVFVESPLIKNDFKTANDWKFAKAIIFGKFIVYVDEEDEKRFDSKDELIEYVTDRFNDGSDKIKVKQTSNNKTITLRREDFI